MILHKLSKHCVQIYQLDLSACKHITSAGFIEIVQHYKYLRKLELSFCDTAVTDTVLATIGMHCKKLTHLGISFCDQVTDFGVCALVAVLSTLLHLDISSCELVSDVSVKNIVRNCTHLLLLDISHCSRFTDAAIHCILKDCKSLLELHLTWSEYTEATFNHKNMKSSPFIFFHKVTGISSTNFNQFLLDNGM